MVSGAKDLKERCLGKAEQMFARNLKGSWYIPGFGEFPGTWLGAWLIAGAQQVRAQWRTASLYAETHCFGAVLQESAL